jgi:hypothetical protein
VAAQKFGLVEDAALAWLAAADPRLAMREHAIAPEGLLEKIGTEGVLAEDVTAQIRGGSLDLFAFRARSRALAKAAAVVGSFDDALPDSGPRQSPLGRPRLERELLERLIAEESARASEESALAESSGDLVRGILSTWVNPAAPQEWADRDAWVAKHLHEVRDSLKERRSPGEPFDLDAALYPLERLLSPVAFPRGAAAIADVRVALDEQPGAVHALGDPARIARAVRVHLGVTVDAANLGGLRDEIARTEVRLRAEVERELPASPPLLAATLQRAAALLFVERPCPAVLGTRVRAMAPPPERAAICGALSALTEEPERAAAVVALHDDIVLALAALTVDSPPRTKLISKPTDEVVDDLRRAARERPVVALGVALAATLLYDAGTDRKATLARIEAWRGLGDAPLDVVAREITHAVR